MFSYREKRFEIYMEKLKYNDSEVEVFDFKCNAWFYLVLYYRNENAMKEKKWEERIRVVTVA